MYSPKIRDELIRPLYLYSKHVGQPMTKTVDQLVYSGLLAASPPPEVIGLLQRIEDHPRPSSLERRLDSAAQKVAEGPPSDGTDQHVIRSSEAQ